MWQKTRDNAPLLVGIYIIILWICGFTHARESVQGGRYGIEPFDGWL